MSTITAELVRQTIDNLDVAIREGLESGNIIEVFRQQKGNLNWIFKTLNERDALGKAVADEFGKPKFLWGCTVAYRAHRDAKTDPQAFIMEQRQAVIQFDRAVVAPAAGPPGDAPVSPADDAQTSLRLTLPPKAALAPAPPSLPRAQSPMAVMKTPEVIPASTTPAASGAATAAVMAPAAVTTAAAPTAKVAPAPAVTQKSPVAVTLPPPQPVAGHHMPKRMQKTPAPRAVAESSLAQRQADPLAERSKYVRKVIGTNKFYAPKCNRCERMDIPCEVRQSRYGSACCECCRRKTRCRMPDEDDDGMDTEDDDAPPAVASEPKPTPAPFRMAVMQAKGGPPPKHPKKAKVVRPKDSRQNNGNKRRQAEQEVPTSRPAVAAMSSGEEGQGRRYTASEKGKMRVDVRDGLEDVVAVHSTSSADEAAAPHVCSFVQRDVITDLCKVIRTMDADHAAALADMQRMNIDLLAMKKRMLHMEGEIYLWKTRSQRLQAALGSMEDAVTALTDYHGMPRDPAGQALFLYDGLEPTRVTRMQRYFSPADEVGQPKASDVDDNEGIADGVEVPVSPASATAEAGSMAPAIANVSRVPPGIPSMPKLNLIPPTPQTSQEACQSAPASRVLFVAPPDHPEETAAFQEPAASKPAVAVDPPSIASAAEQGGAVEEGLASVAVVPAAGNMEVDVGLVPLPCPAPVSIPATGASAALPPALSPASSSASPSALAVPLQLAPDAIPHKATTKAPTSAQTMLLPVSLVPTYSPSPPSPSSHLLSPRPGPAELRRSPRLADRLPSPAPSGMQSRSRSPHPSEPSKKRLAEDPDEEAAIKRPRHQ